MYTKGGDRWGPFQVVAFFQARLNESGNPIRFTPESSLPKQLKQAKRLIAVCKSNRAEVEALIEEFCKDKWEVEKNPDLARVLAKADELRASLAQYQQEGRCQTKFRAPRVI